MGSALGVPGLEAEPSGNVDGLKLREGMAPDRRSRADQREINYIGVTTWESEWRDHRQYVMTATEKALERVEEGGG